MNISFKLTLEIETPVIMGPVRTTLDGLLSSAIFREQGLMGKDVWPFMPLASESGIYKASSVFFPIQLGFERVGRIMRLSKGSDQDISMFSPNSRGLKYIKVDIARGKYKANLSSYRAIAANEAYFWAVGDPERTVELIENFILGLGRHASSGAGQIRSVRWEASEDYSWITEKGTPARQLPIEVWNEMTGGKHAYTAHVAVQLPYWETEAVLSVLPETLSV